MISKRNFLAITFTLCILVQVSLQLSDNFPQKVIEFMGSRKMRYHHFLWHNIRENWLLLKAETQYALTKLGWAPPRPSLAYKPDGTGIALEENGSGEDFFYMHRQMVIQTNKMVADTDYERIVGWKHCPYPGDPKMPVSANYESGDPIMNAMLTEAKRDDFFWSDIQPNDALLEDPDFLRSVSLAKLGSLVEYTVHKWMHLRFSDPGTVGLRFTSTVNPTPDIDTKWDNLGYRWLGDTYSSHVHPTFWKIHGWVDDHIDLWRKANGLETITWEGTWQNGPEETIEDLFAAGATGDADPDADADADSDSDCDENLEKMSQAVRILLQDGFEDSFRKTVETSLTRRG